MNRKLFKKGAAMEMTLVMMLTLFTLCASIYASSYRRKIRDTYQNENQELLCDIEGLGEDFYSRIANSVSDTLYGEDLLESLRLKQVYAFDDYLLNRQTYESSSIEDNYTLEVYSITGKEEVTDENGETKEVDVEKLYLRCVVSVNKEEKKVKVIEWYFNNPLDENDYIDIVEEEYLES